jgi:hypothetical protein
MNRVSDVLNRVCELTLMLFLSAMTVAVFLEILFRYLFHFPLFWTEEFGLLSWAHPSPSKGESTLPSPFSSIVFRLLLATS